MIVKFAVKINRFGKGGNILTTVLFSLAMAAAAIMTIATIVFATLPKDAIVVGISEKAQIRLDGDHFGTLWNSLVDCFSYAGDTEPDLGQVPEDTELNVDLSFFNHEFSSATVHSDGDQKVIEASSDVTEYRSGDLLLLLISLTLFLVSVVGALWMLKRLFKELSGCQSPFCDAIVTKMRDFSFSLIPLALFASFADTVSSSFLTAGPEMDLSIQWGVIIAFVVVLCLVTVFKYGVQLQRESDETL